TGSKQNQQLRFEFEFLNFYHCFGSRTCRWRNQPRHAKPVSLVAISQFLSLSWPATRPKLPAPKGEPVLADPKLSAFITVLAATLIGRQDKARRSVSPILDFSAFTNVFVRSRRRRSLGTERRIVDSRFSILLNVLFAAACRTVQQVLVASAYLQTTASHAEPGLI